MPNKLFDDKFIIILTVREFRLRPTFWNIYIISDYNQIAGFYDNIDSLNFYRLFYLLNFLKSLTIFPGLYLVFSKSSLVITFLLLLKPHLSHQYNKLGIRTYITTRTKLTSYTTQEPNISKFDLTEYVLH